MRPERYLLVWWLVLVLLLAGCAGKSPKDGPPRSGSVIPRDLPEDPVPRQESKSRYGNGPYYEALGKRYEVMGSSYGYQERGVASWYGNKFHGRQTSSHERYDMYAMTAAHKSLPLPTYVRVRNLRNHKSVIVRVNDRGPFVANRIIDLSYSAALRLDMIRQGTSLVEVTAISFDKPPDPPPVAPAPAEVKPEKAKAIAPEKTEADVYVQVGAFGDAENARRRFALLRTGGVGNAFVLEDYSQSPALYRVRIGPIADVVQYDSLVVRLQNLGISETHLV
ncbi:MAG: septal ring lytic transglycosylase RlpA family protein, partial [Gammaproteobacteria bacterium]